MTRPTFQTLGLAAAVLATATLGAARAQAQVTAPSTWATGITMGVTPRDEFGTPIGSPDPAEFDDWASVPIAVVDPEDNPSFLNLIDIREVQVANDSDFIYIRIDSYDPRTNGLYLAFDTDQDVGTGFDIFGLGLVGSEIGYQNDFVFDQRDSGNFNQNNTETGNCCTGGPLDLNNGGALIYPEWDIEFGEREWAIPLDAVFSEVAPFDPTFPNPTFNFIAWTDQGLTDVTDVITYTLAEPPASDADFNDDTFVDGADFVAWQRGFGLASGATNAQGDANGDGAVDGADLDAWQSGFGIPPAVGATTGVPEPAAIGLVFVALAGLACRRR